MDTIYLSDNPQDVPEQYKQSIISKQYINSIIDSSCKNLFIDGSYFSEESILGLVKKLRHGGKITLMGPDLQEISRCVLSGYLKPNDARNLIHDGEKLYTAYEIIGLLKNSGLKITQKRVNNFKYAITAERE